MSRLSSIAPPETILVVDDNSAVLRLVSLILKEAGFIVFSAASPEEAIQISLQFAGTIHLLLTDVMMPGMSGPDLANTLIEQRNTLRVMMMTGYPGGDLLLLNDGWHVIPKPFVVAALCEKVNDVLHSPDRSQGADHFDTRSVATRNRTPTGCE